MWVLESFGGVVVAGPFKSEAEMAKKLGLSQQYVNRQISNGNLRFRLDGRNVLARRAWAFLAGTKGFTEKGDIGAFLGVPQEAIDKVFRKNTSGFVQTPNGKVKIQKLKPGEKPTLPAVRVLWDDDTEKQDFVSFADAAKELKIDPKTIPNALKAGRDSFTRKSDGKKFTIEIPEENTPSRKKPKPLSEEQKAKRAEAERQRAIEEKLELPVWEFYSEHVACRNPPSFKSQVEYLELFWPGQMAKIRAKLAPEEKPPAEKEPQPLSEEPPQQSKEDPSEEEETHSEDPFEEEDPSEEEDSSEEEEDSSEE